MSDDQIRALFRQADRTLGHAPPDLDQTIRRAKRDAVRSRLYAAAGTTAIVVVVAFAAWTALRPDTESVAPIASATPAPSVVVEPCLEGTTGENPVTFVEEFMRRRVSGAGAEACLTNEAVDQYRTQQADPYDPNANGGAGPLCLYACGEFRVVDYNFDTEPRDLVDANSYQGAVIVMLSDGNETVRQYEAFAIGPGAASTTGEPQPFVIRGAWTTPGVP